MLDWGHLTRNTHSIFQALSRRNSELESLKAEWSASRNSLSSEHSVSIASEREKALKAQAEMADRFSREKRELEELHSVKVCLFVLTLGRQIMHICIT